MKLKMLIASLAIIACSSNLFAAVILTVPEEIKLLAVNEQYVNQGILNKQKQYQLSPGVQHISLRYQEFFQHTDNSHDIVKSEAFNFVTPALNAGEYSLRLLQAPKDFDSAKQYQRQPIIGLYDNQQQLISKQSADQLPLTPPLQSLIQNKTTSSHAIPAFKTPTKINPAAFDQQLIQLWQQASISERQRFMNWIAEQAK